jgi:hypothetical protein
MSSSFLMKTAKMKLKAMKRSMYFEGIRNED